jgi:hypothetical protein
MNGMWYGRNAHRACSNSEEFMNLAICLVKPTLVQSDPQLSTALMLLP